MLALVPELTMPPDFRLHNSRMGRPATDDSQRRPTMLITPRMTPRVHLQADQGTRARSPVHPKVQKNPVGEFRNESQEAEREE